MDVKAEYGIDVIHNKTEIFEETQNSKVHSYSKDQVLPSGSSASLFIFDLACHEPVETCTVQHQENIYGFSPAVEYQACDEKHDISEPHVSGRYQIIYDQKDRQEIEEECYTTKQHL